MWCCTIVWGQFGALFLIGVEHYTLGTAPIQQQLENIFSHQYMLSLEYDPYYGLLLGGGSTPMINEVAYMKQIQGMIRKALSPGKKSLHDPIHVHLRIMVG